MPASCSPFTLHSRSMRLRLVVAEPTSRGEMKIAWKTRRGEALGVVKGMATSWVASSVSA
jgi:hypothetical protein